MEVEVTGSMAREALGAATIAEAFRITVAERAEEVAIRTKGDAFSITWGELRERVDALAGGLAKLGVGRGDSVALMLSNRPEFHLCDLAAMMLGATPFSIYNTYTPEQIRYVVSDAGAKVLICEQQYLPQVREARRELPDLEYVIVIDGEAPLGTLALSDVEGSNPDFDVDASVAQISSTDVLTLIYTSGTTGPPKGVQLVHRNLLATVQGIEHLIDFPRDGRVISWLPAAHVAERNAHHYLPIVFGLQITCCDDPREVLSYLPEVRPSWFFAVPRIWEKLKAGLETMIAGAARRAQRAVAGGGRRRACARCASSSRRTGAGGAGRAGGDGGRGDLLGAALDARARPGRGDQRRRGADAGRGARVLPRDRPAARRAVGHERDVRRRERQPARTRSSSAPSGRPRPGIEIKLDTDGEVLVKSDVVMLGYRNLPEKTAEAFTEDGWLRTGDIGSFDEDGYLTIVDRKKELIISAAGKNMSPANIEATLKSGSPLIGQACCIGDRRPYNTALIVLDADFAPDVGGTAGHRGHDARVARPRRARARGGAGGCRRRQREARSRRTDQEVRDRRGRLAAGRRRADAHDEAQAQADRREVRERDRRALRGVAGYQDLAAPRSAGPNAYSSQSAKRRKPTDA